TTVFCCAAATGVAYLLKLKLPYGYEEAFALTGIFFAALIATLIYIPVIQSAGGQGPWRFLRTYGGIVLLSTFVAIASSAGGGIVRRWITDHPTVLSSPLHQWWSPMFMGWALALVACLLNLNVYAKYKVPRRMLDNIDAWIMGVFAVAGAMAALDWTP